MRSNKARLARSCADALGEKRRWRRKNPKNQGSPTMPKKPLTGWRLAPKGKGAHGPERSEGPSNLGESIDASTCVTRHAYVLFCLLMREMFTILLGLHSRGCALRKFRKQST